MNRRRLFYSMLSVGLGLDTLNPILSNLCLRGWESKTWEAGTHYWRFHPNGELFFQYKNYGQQDFVSVQKFSSEGEFQREMVPQKEVNSKKEALKIISAYQ